MAERTIVTLGDTLAALVEGKKYTTLRDILVTVTEVRGLVIHGGVHAGIEQEDLQLAARGGVAGLIGR